MLEAVKTFFWGRIRSLKRKLKSFPRLHTAFYFFGLEKGCRIIAIIEALMSLVQILIIHHQLRESGPSSMLPDPHWVTRMDQQGIIRRIFLYRTTHYFTMGLDLVTVLNSILLIIGSKWGYQVCLFLWIYNSVFTTIVTNLNNTMRNFTITQVFLAVPSITLETYYMLIVASLISKLNEKAHDRNLESEGLSSESDEL
ncbi:uncharacterized protein LOC108101857 [Drosophila ficusphila]|uniref:uncharacterized protein LOC108101857 n=1 Tax=Drosophila ficusphila TaxID=30025 RepID=UPI0007E72DA0|nr:uncharacterized protein LOC108101857 [Drosophila ficusphila]